MKYYKTIGLVACSLLIISCFLPWAYYPDIHKSFTGFFSEKNIYGKPGKVFVFIALCSLICVFLDKIWAKRAIIFLSAINIGYLIKTFVVFTSCYSTVCPHKEYGIYLLMFSSILLLAVAIFPNMKLENKEEFEDTSLPASEEK